MHVTQDSQSLALLFEISDHNLAFLHESCAAFVCENLV